MYTKYSEPLAVVVSLSLFSECLSNSTMQVRVDIWPSPVGS